jgi:hypothetical protein
MNKQIARTLLLAVLSWFCSHAYAVPKVTTYPYPAHQVGDTSYVRAGLLVIGESSWTGLTIGGGYTLTCGVQTVVAENATYAPFLAGYNSGLVHVPSINPADYDVGGFASLPAGNCRACSFQYRGRVLEGHATINAPSHGAGFVFSIGGVEITQADTQTFNICRPTSPNRNTGCLQ